LTSLALARGYERISVPQTWGAEEQRLWDELAEVIQFHTEEMSSSLFHRAYAQLWRGITLINTYVHVQQPWKLQADAQERFLTVLAAGLHGVSVIALFAWPVMPKKMEQLLE